MTINVEVKGRAADRFRAYGPTKLLRSANGEDHRKRALAGEEPLPPRTRVRYDGEQVVAEGSVSGKSVTISAGKETVTRVVFYRGPVESEAVVGSAEVNASGTIELAMVEPPPSGRGDDVMVIDV